MKGPQIIPLCQLDWLSNAWTPFFSLEPFDEDVVMRMVTD